MPDTARAFVDVAIRAGRQAAEICRKVQAFEKLTGVPLAKAGNEPVTVADYASQAVILRALRAAFPDHAILAEENSAHLKQQHEASVQHRVRDLVAEVLGEPLTLEDVMGFIDHQGDPRHAYRWAIDPIDGTKGFIRREQYAVAIGLLKDHEPFAGVLVCPNLAVDEGRPDGGKGVIMAALRGQGAWQVALDGGAEKAIHVNRTTDPAHVRVLGSVESSHGDPAVLQALVEEEGFKGGVVRVDSQVKYAVLARGGAEIYVRPQSRPGWREKVWDHAAGMLVAREAGATTTDLEGHPLDFSRGKLLELNRGVVTTHGPMHDRVIAALARIGGSSA